MTDNTNKVKIVIDTREHALYDLLKTETRIAIEVKPLLIGDITIQNNDKDVVIIERKTIADLSSSITDGRYREQSVRLNAEPIHNHNIYYLIEGKIPNKGSSNIYSAMFSLSYYKGFSVIRSFNLAETATIVVSMALKLEKENNKKNGFYDNLITNDETLAEYSPALVKKKKSDNITPDNFFGIVLCQIPSVSEATANTITEKYSTLQELMSALHENPNCLDGLTHKSSKRKISKTSIANVKKFLIL